MGKHEKKESEKEEKVKTVEDGVVLAPIQEKWEEAKHYAEPLIAKEVGEFEVILPWQERNEILTAAKATHGEIAGWAEAEVDLAKRTIRLGRVAIPEQKAGAANAEIDGEQTHALALAGELDLGKAIVSWHSHVNMQAEPSHVDLQAYRKMGDMMPIFVGIVMNKKNMWWVEVWIKTAIGPIRFVPQLDFEEPNAVKMPHIEELVKKRLKERQYALPQLPAAYRGGHRICTTRWSGYGENEQYFVNAVLQVWNRKEHRFIDAPKGYDGPSGKFDRDPINDSKPAVTLGPVGTVLAKLDIWEFLSVTCFALPEKPVYDCEEDICDEAGTFRLVFSETPGARSYCMKHMSALRDVLVRAETKISKERVRRQERDSKQLTLVEPKR